MASKFKIHPLNMALQAGKLNSVFPSSELLFDQNTLKWKNTLVPSPLSNSYEIKLHYVRGKNPNVYVINPKLSLFPGKSRLPHVYSTPQQRLCLYYRKAREWNSSMHLADTIIPWTCEWLVHYELWLITGTWHGGGIDHETEAEKQANQETEN